jgi:hypothetical protein
MAIEGGCLCGGVRYAIEGQIGEAANCHCSMCRRWSGAAFITAAGVPTKNFRWTKGENLLGRYESSPGGLRVFCSRCGSTLVGMPKDPNAPELWVMFGSLDGDPGVRASSNIYVGSKAPWYTITDSLPQYAELPK